MEIINRELVCLTEYDDIYNAWYSLGVNYTPPLFERINPFSEYIAKIHQNGKTYAVMIEKKLAGAISFYSNDKASKAAFITQLCTDKSFRKCGVASLLVRQCEKIAKANGMDKVMLEVKKDNENAILFYRKYGFEIKTETEKNSYIMLKFIDSN